MICSIASCNITLLGNLQCHELYYASVASPFAIVAELLGDLQCFVRSHAFVLMLSIVVVVIAVFSRGVIVD